MLPKNCKTALPPTSSHVKKLYEVFSFTLTETDTGVLRLNVNTLPCTEIFTMRKVFQNPFTWCMTFWFKRSPPGQPEPKIRDISLAIVTYSRCGKLCEKITLDNNIDSV